MDVYPPNHSAPAAEDFEKAAAVWNAIGQREKDLASEPLCVLFPVLNTSDNNKGHGSRIEASHRISPVAERFERKEPELTGPIIPTVR